MTTEEHNWAGCYYDHFERYLGQPIDREIFSIGELPKIQVLAYKNVFPNCITFGSIGLTRFFNTPGQIGEAIVVVDNREEGWEHVPTLFANALFRLIHRNHPLHEGAMVPTQDLVPEFFEKFAKSGLYFTTPYTIDTLPQDFDKVTCNSQCGEVYAGYFVSPQEYDVWHQKGPLELEKMFILKELDMMDLRRPSCI